MSYCQYQPYCQDENTIVWNLLQAVKFCSFKTRIYHCEGVLVALCAWNAAWAHKLQVSFWSKRIPVASVSEVNCRSTAHMAGHCIWRPRTYWVNVVVIIWCICSGCSFTACRMRTALQRRRWRYGPYSCNGRRLFSASPASDACGGSGRRQACFYKPGVNCWNVASTRRSTADVWWYRPRKPRVAGHGTWVIWRPS